MNLSELIEKLQDLYDHGTDGNSPVALLGADSIPHSVRSVESEFHEDAGGAWTVWIRMEEI